MLKEYYQGQDKKTSAGQIWYAGRTLLTPVKEGTIFHLFDDLYGTPHMDMF